MQISTTEIARRQQAVREIMAEQNIDLLICGSSATINGRAALRYFIDCYVHIFEELLVIPLAGDIAYFPYDRVRSSYADEFFGVEYSDFLGGAEGGKKVADYAKRFLPLKIGTYGFDFLSRRLLSSLTGALNGISLVDLSKEIDSLRMKQSAEEISASKEAIAINEAVFTEYVKHIAVGKCEMDAVVPAATFASAHGCEDQFWMVGSGREVCAPLPLAKKRNHIWQKGEVNTIIIEHSVCGGYFGEVMHSVFVGEPEREAVQAFEVIVEALQMTGRIIRPGITAGQLADEIDSFMLQKGVFSRADTRQPLGHGQGLSIAESPLVQHGNETVLVARMRLNIHPAVTLKSGERIVATDCYIVEESGARRLSALSYGPIHL